MTNKHMACFIPEENVAYPLCVGRGCYCCCKCSLYWNIEDEGGYSYYDK